MTVSAKGFIGSGQRPCRFSTTNRNALQGWEKLGPPGGGLGLGEVMTGKMSRARKRRARNHPCLSEARFQRDRPERVIIHVFERHRHHLARPVDRHLAKELQAFAGWNVLALLLGRRLDVHQLWPE